MFSFDGPLTSRKGKRKTSETSIFDINYTKENVHNIAEYWTIVLLLFVFLIGCYTRYNYRDNLPKALGNNDLLNKPTRFIAERAWKDLEILTNFGAKPTGSYNNEVLAVDFLKREISYIQQMAHPTQKIEMDVQVVSGAYWAAFKPHGMTNVYRNVQNVVVKLHGQSSDFHGNGNHSLMLNCHFDSVAGSPGSSDDGASCCVMLEILRVLSRRNVVNKHSIIFLFNGAEETPLQASHGFITQHKWAKEIRAFINLESVGSAGKEILFQTGPKHPWLIKMYGQAASHPNAQVAAEEVFQSGLIPSDTDFRIFRDFGKIPGVDLAHVINGYRYHTKYDHIKFIPKSVLQHTGDNILALTKLIANSEELSNTEKHAEGSEVFFDILGFVFVHYSVHFAKIFNYVVVSLSIVLPYIFLSRATQGINRKYLRYEIILGFLVNVICFVGANAACYAIAYDVDRAGRPMSWYSYPILVITVYCVATLAVQCSVHLLFNRNKKAPMSIALKTQARLTGTSLFWGLLAAAITMAEYKIGYVIVVPQLITLITNSLIGFMGLQNTIRKWLYVHLGGQVLVVLWATHFYHVVFDMFIPIAGRSGGAKNPDLLIAIISCSLTFFITSYLTPLVILLKRSRHFLLSLLAIYVISRYYFVAFTKYGFPYRDNSNGFPAVQRHFITHTMRTVHDLNGTIQYTDAGFWMRELDRNAKKTIESLIAPDEPIPQMKNNLCQTQVFCGLPFYSCRQLHTDGFWVPSPQPLVRETGLLVLTNRRKLSPTEIQLSFELTGSYLMSLQIRPKPGMTLANWNIMESVPEPNVYLNQKAYFVMITHGLEAPTMNITLNFKTNEDDFNGPLVDIALVTFHWEYHKEHTPTFANLLAKVPTWAFVVPSVASYKSWVY